MDDYLRRVEWTKQQRINEKVNDRVKVFTDANLVDMDAT